MKIERYGLRRTRGQGFRINLTLLPRWKAKRKNQLQNNYRARELDALKLLEIRVLIRNLNTQHAYMYIVRVTQEKIIRFDMKKYEKRLKTYKYMRICISQRDDFAVSALTIIKFLRRVCRVKTNPRKKYVRKGVRGGVWCFWIRHRCWYFIDCFFLEKIGKRRDIRSGPSVIVRSIPRSINDKIYVVV